MISLKRAALSVLSMVLLSVSLITCSSDDSSNSPLDRPGDQSLEDITITIGVLTDQTGVSASALEYIDLAFEDTVNHFNKEGLIPGVKLDVIKYDTYYDTSRFVLGYENLLSKGADVIVNFLPPGVPILQSRADSDKIPIFTMTANVEPGDLDGSYVYCLATVPAYEAYTVLDWIAENDPEFPKDRPARIGGCAYTETYSNILFSAAKEYCKYHPDQYEWEATFLSDFKFSFDAEIEALKDCDYVFTPSPPMTFVKAYRQGGGQAKIVWTEIHAAFTGMFDKDQLDMWDEIDGSYIILSSGWYNDQNDPVIKMINEVLDSNHSEDKAEEIRRNGGGYRTVMRADMICQIIKETVEREGAANFNNEALAQTANSWSFTYGNIENFCNFTRTKRFSQDYYLIFELQADESNPHSWQYVTRVSPEPILQVTSSQK